MFGLISASQKFAAALLCSTNEMGLYASQRKERQSDTLLAAARDKRTRSVSNNNKNPYTHTAYTTTWTSHSLAAIEIRAFQVFCIILHPKMPYNFAQSTEQLYGPNHSYTFGAHTKRHLTQLHDKIEHNNLSVHNQQTIIWQAMYNQIMDKQIKFGVWPVLSGAALSKPRVSWQFYVCVRTCVQFDDSTTIYHWISLSNHALLMFHTPHMPLFPDLLHFNSEFIKYDWLGHNKMRNGWWIQKKIFVVNRPYFFSRLPCHYRSAADGYVFFFLVLYSSRCIERTFG